MPNQHYRSTGINPKFPGLVRALVGAIVVSAVAVTIVMPGGGLAHGSVAVAKASRTDNVRWSQTVAGQLTRHLRVAFVSLPALRAHDRATPFVAQSLVYQLAPTPSSAYVVSLIHSAFPRAAWHDAEAVAWCESKFRASDIAFDSNGTHDRGIFQLNDGGTEQYLLGRLGLNPNNLDLAFNPVLNVRAAAVLFARDGWSQWSCASAL